MKHVFLSNSGKVDELIAREDALAERPDYTIQTTLHELDDKVSSIRSRWFFSTKNERIASINKL